MVSLAVAAAVIGGVLVAAPAPASAAVPQGPPTRSGGVDGPVYATLVVGDTVYVGGSFTQAQSQGGSSTPRADLAAFDLGSGALLGSWRADVNGTVRGLASAGGYLYVGGTYSTIGGVAQARLARVSLATGAVDTGFRPRLDSGVRAVAVGGGAVYAGGQFTESGGTAQDRLAKFDATSGAKLTAFTGSANGNVNALALSPDGTRLAVGGAFTTLSGTARRGLGLVDSTTGHSTGPSFAGSVDPMLTVSWAADGSAVFGGSGNYNNLAARWSASSGARRWGITVGGDLQAIADYDGTAYVGFHDNYQGDTHTKLLAVDDATGAISTAFRPTFDEFWGIRSISAGPWGLVIGGEFTTISGVWAHNWAIWPSARSAPAMAVSAPERTTYGARTTVDVSIPGASGTVTLTGLDPASEKPLTDGSARFVLPRTLPAGRHTLTASYSGDDRYAPATETVALRVTKAATEVRTTVARRATTALRGRLRVTVASEVRGGAAPQGRVRLRLTHGARHRALGPRELDGSTATFPLPKLASGTWRVVARYGGDPDHRAAAHTSAVRVTRGR